MAAVFTNPEMAMALVPVIIIPFMVMAGFFVNQNSIPYFFYPYEYLSTFKYNFQPAIIVFIIYISSKKINIFKRMNSQTRFGIALPMFNVTH